MTSTLASVLHLAVHIVDRPNTGVSGNARPLGFRFGPGWRRLVGGLANAIRSLSVAHPTPSDHALSRLSSTDKPRH